MKRYILLTMYFVAATLLSSCSKSGSNTEPPQIENTPKNLAFSVESVDTRAAVTTTGSILNFGVFCFNTAKDQWEAVKASATPNKMYDQHVVFKGNKWVYEPTAYWEADDGRLHSFFVYSPFATGMVTDVTPDGEPNDNGNNIVVSTDKNTPGVPSIRFETLSSIQDQVDLLIAHPQYNLHPVDNVLITFTHALSRVGFKAYSDVAGTFVDKIEITGIKYKGAISTTTPIAWATDAATADFVIDFGSGVPVLADKSKPIDITASGRYLMTVPQSWESNTTAKVKIYYRQGGESYSPEFTIGVNGESWSSNLGVMYVLDLNGTPNSEMIVDRVVIEDWKMGVNTGSDVGLTGEMYWLRFDANGGSGAMPSDRELETGSLYKIGSETPTNVALTFDGWNTSTDGLGTRYIAGQRISIKDSNITLYAQWK